MTIGEPIIKMYYKPFYKDDDVIAEILHPISEEELANALKNPGVPYETLDASQFELVINDKEEQ